MSAKKIRALLKKKNIPVIAIAFQKSCPTPSGYASGYNLEFSEDVEESVCSKDMECEFHTFMEFDNLQDVITFIDTLPTLTKE